MEERSANDIIKDFAKNTNRNIEFSHTMYPLSSYRKIERYKTIAYIPNNQDESCFFVWVNDPYRVIGEYSSFSGVFIPISSGYKGSFSIRAKNILDNFNVVSLIKNIWADKSGFSSKVVISGNDPDRADELFNGTMAGHKVFEALKLSPAMRITLNLPVIDFIPALKGKNYIGIVNPQEWFLEREIVEKMLKIGETFLHGKTPN
jgi:hypothetical protein